MSQIWEWEPEGIRGNENVKNRSQSSVILNLRRGHFVVVKK